MAEAQAGSPVLRFNISHTNGLVALAVARGHRVGLDVEAVTRPVLEDIPERQRSRFFDYWTLKEAYIKARGMGLALPLDQFAFALAPGSPPAIRFAAGFDDDPTRWQFWQAWPTPTHRLSLAIERDGADLPVALRQVTPAQLAL